MAQPKEVLDMKGIHSGQRVFMIGNGPSLWAQMDILPRLNEELTVACNHIYRWEECPIAPTYWGITEPDIKACHRKALDLFQMRWPDAIPLLLHDSPDFLGEDARDIGWTWVERSGQQIRDHGFEGLGHELIALPSGWTTPLTIAQFMAWCGVREFFFIGMDITGDGWVYPNDGGRTLHERSIRAIGQSFQRAKEDIEAVGGTITNCTAGGNLPKFIERVSLEEVLDA